MMYLNRRQLAIVLECSERTALRKYPTYLQKVGKENWQKLTIEDISYVEKRRIKDIKDMLY